MSTSRSWLVKGSKYLAMRERQVPQGLTGGPTNLTEALVGDTDRGQEFVGAPGGVEAGTSAAHAPGEALAGDTE